MKLKVFAIPASGDEAAEKALNEFTAKHRVAQIDRQLVQNGATSYWSVCVGYFESAVAQTSGKKTGKVDYREVLSLAEFRDYAALREWRKETCDNESIPAFGVFTNEQLANIVRLPTLSMAALGRIDGVGQIKCERYGQAVLTLLKQRRSANSDKANTAIATSSTGELVNDET